MPTLRWRSNDRLWSLEALCAGGCVGSDDTLRQRLEAKRRRNRLSTRHLKGDVFSGVFCAQSKPCSVLYILL